MVVWLLRFIPDLLYCPQSLQVESASGYCSLTFLLTCPPSLPSSGAAGGHLSPASPVLRSALVVPAGQNAMLPCNLTSCSDLTWYLLRSDHLLPLLTVTSTKLGGDTVTFYTADEGRFNRQGGLESGGVSLEIQEVQQEDAGLYFCSCRCKGAVCVDRGIHLALDGKKVSYLYIGVSVIRFQLWGHVCQRWN